MSRVYFPYTLLILIKVDKMYSLYTQSTLSKVDIIYSINCGCMLPYVRCVPVVLIISLPHEIIKCRPKTIFLLLQICSCFIFDIILSGSDLFKCQLLKKNFLMYFFKYVHYVIKEITFNLI